MSEEMQYTEVVEEVPTVNPEADSMSTKALVWGNLGLAMSGWGVLGLIFSIIGKNCANSFERMTGELSGKAKVGSILAKIGLIISIVMTVIWGLYFLIIVAAILGSM